MFSGVIKGGIPQDVALLLLAVFSEHHNKISTQEGVEDAQVHKESVTVDKIANEWGGLGYTC